MKILIFSKYNRIGPSSYYRQYQFIEKIPQLNSITIKYFYGNFYFKYILKEKGIKKKLLLLLVLLFYYFKRITYIVLFSWKYDVVKIEKELLPGLPVFIEYFIKIVLKKKIIYEYDDAMFLSTFPKNKTDKILKLADHVIAGNLSLSKYAKKYNPNVSIIPTGVLYQEYKEYVSNKISKNKTVNIGWIGTINGLLELKTINLENIFCELNNKGYDFIFTIISNQDIEMAIKNKKFIKWDRQSSLINMADFDIGIMPVEENDFNKYKCGFKIIQYMAMSIPVVASPVGVNSEIVLDGETGFLARNNENWIKALEKLIINSELRSSLSSAAYRNSASIFDLKILNTQYNHVYDKIMK